MSDTRESDPPTRTFGPVLIAVGLGVLWLSGGIENTTVGHNDDPGPRAFPIITALILVAGGVYESIRYFLGRRSHRRLSTVSSETSPAPDNRQALFLVAGLGIYLFAMPWVGFPAATFVFSLALMLRLGSTKVMAATASASLVLAIYLLFVLLFKVQLPPGVLGLSW
jgi:acyl-CoA reductase-like NAD-dependent aldehyde dehydrogenase